MRWIGLWMLVAIGIAAPAQVLTTKTYGTTGRAAEAWVSPDGQYVLVTVDIKGDGSGIDVFHQEGDKLKRVAFQPLGKENAQGILLIPHTQTLAVGLSNEGVGFLPLDDALRGKAKVMVLPQGEGAGSGYLAATADGKELYVANEYGKGGNVGVILLHPNGHGGIDPELTVQLPSGRATPGIALSPDGTRLYAVAEIVKAARADNLPGHDVKELRHDGCEQKGGRSMPNGMLYAFDTAKAIALPKDAAMDEIHGSLAGWTDAGCSPVRIAGTKDGSLLFVTARGDNRVLVFDAAKLGRGDGDALVAAIPSKGEAPVGVALFDGGKYLLVADSNRFSTGNGNAAVIDVSNPKSAKVVQKINTGAFPRNITVSADGKTLYMTVFGGEELMVLKVAK